MTRYDPPLPVQGGVVKGGALGGKRTPIKSPTWRKVTVDCWWPECWWYRLTGYTCIHEHVTQVYLERNLPTQVAYRMGFGRRYPRYRRD